MSLVTDVAHAQRMDRMYRYQRHIYDISRKYYLLGRDRLISEMNVPPGGTVLEIGCGTGRNLDLIGRRYPSAHLFGFDISARMIESAAKKLSGRRVPVVLRVADATDFRADAFGETGFDRIVISYALSMIPGWEKALVQATQALNPGGSLHIADFGQQERLPSLARRLLHAWLGRFHVSPRAGLFDAISQLAAANGDTVACTTIGRGYAWLAVYRRAKP